jgi:hypothetical protein
MAGPDTSVLYEIFICFETNSENGKLNIFLESSEENSAEAVAPSCMKNLKIFQDMAIPCLSKSRNEPTALKTLLLGKVMLFCSTLSRLKIRLNYTGK